MKQGLAKPDFYQPELTRFKPNHDINNTGADHIQVLLNLLEYGECLLKRHVAVNHNMHVSLDTISLVSSPEIVNIQNSIYQ